MAKITKNAMKPPVEGRGNYARPTRRSLEDGSDQWPGDQREQKQQRSN
jgi:hypothetical protein